jgi:hypothetical protein
MVAPGPRSGARDNGLRCASYAAVGDLDPRVADAMLETLRSEGIAAYVIPTPGARGGYLEVHVPSRLTDRLFADAERAERAGELMAGADTHTEIDFESAWQQLLGSLQSPESASPAPVAPPWPASEDVEDVEDVEGSMVTLSGDPALDEHYVPPPPPPLPRLRRVTLLALLAIAAGLFEIVTGFDNADLGWLGIPALLVGGGTLVWHLKDGPPRDSGWDDGAIV